MMATPPWDPPPPLNEALQSIEAIARQRGGDSTSGPSFPEQALVAAEQRLGAPIPADLREYLRWYDRAVWSRFVHSSGTRGDLYGIDSLDEVCHLGAEDHSHLSAHIKNLRWQGADSRAHAWERARLLSFGSSTFGEPLLYVLAAPGFETGTILTTTEDDPSVLWLADSLSQWLARLAACDGYEYAFVPGMIDELDARIRAAYVPEFHARNPGTSFFRR